MLIGQGDIGWYLSVMRTSAFGLCRIQNLIVFRWLRNKGEVSGVGLILPLCVRNLLLQQWTRKPSWRKGNARQRRHSKMAVSRHLLIEFYRNENSAIRLADPENPNLEPNMEWIGCTVYTPDIRL